MNSEGKNLVVQPHGANLKQPHGANLKGGNENLVTCTTVDEQSGFSTKKYSFGEGLIAFLYFWKGFHGRLFFQEYLRVLSW